MSVLLQLTKEEKTTTETLASKALIHSAEYLLSVSVCQAQC